MGRKVYLINQSYGDGLEHLKEELAEALVRNYEVYVITGRNGKKFLKRHELSRGIEIFRISNWKLERTLWGRLKSYSSFVLGALWRIIRIKKGSIVIVTTQPFFVARLVQFFKRLKRLQIIYNVQDLYPDILIALGKKSGADLFSRLLYCIQRKTLVKSDLIVAIGEPMKKLISERYRINEEKITVIENWGMASLENDKDDREDRPVEGKLRALYTGNMGNSHEIATLSEAIRIIARDFSESPVLFRFVGLGSNYTKLREICIEERISFAEFSDPVSKKNLLREHLNSDVSLVISDRRIEGTLVPSKFYTAVRFNPVVFIGSNTDTPAAHILKGGFGYVVKNGDPGRLVSVLIGLHLDRKQIDRMRMQAKLYHSTELHSSIRIRQWNKALDGLAENEN